MARWVASLGDGLVSVPVAALPWPLPANASGLVVHRPATLGIDPLEFVAVDASELVRAGLTMTRLGRVVSVVACPAGVSPAAAALALAVGEALGARRGGGRVVTAPVCPPLGQGRTAVPHEVRVTAGRSVQWRRVWELVAWPDLPAWREQLGPRPVAA